MATPRWLLTHPKWAWLPATLRQQRQPRPKGRAKMKIDNSEEPLDVSIVHPENYPLVRKILEEVEFALLNCVPI